MWKSSSVFYLKYVLKTTNKATCVEDLKIILFDSFGTTIKREVRFMYFYFWYSPFTMPFVSSTDKHITVRDAEYSAIYQTLNNIGAFRCKRVEGKKHSVKVVFDNFTIVASSVLQ